MAAGTIPLESLLHLPTLDETYGALLIGTFVSLLLYGVVVHQAYRYTQMYKDDSLAIKLTVFVLITIDTVHTVVSAHACYAYLVSHYFTPLALLEGIWSIQCQPVLAGLGVLVSQSFFTRRVYIVSRKYGVLVATSLLLTLATFGCAVAGTVIAFKLRAFTQYEHYYWIDSAACACAVVADMLTTSVLIFTLRRSRTGFRRTDTLINSLMLYSINTGLLTGIANCLALVFAIARPDTFIWIALEIVAVRLYTNSVMAVLNSRRSLREAHGDEMELTVGGFYNTPTNDSTPPQMQSNLRALEDSKAAIDLTASAPFGVAF
ncbi:hypothetical protein LXA43DRAFT_1094746 [Ganoderma leucocontextum]|nr:hypothetical protein LXA43DRAFT_1094746 [Ganoderma leucocontextum]